MNIFKKIGLINKGLNTIKEIKKLIDTTTIDDELKGLFLELVSVLERIKNKIPAGKDFIAKLIEIIKKNFKIDKK